MTKIDVLLSEGETLVPTSDELIYRQIAEWMVPEGGIQTSAFGPATSDNGKPSYARSSVVTAQEARDWHNSNARSRSVGVWALTVDEVDQEERLVVDDSGSLKTPDSARAPGHCYIDFRGLSKADTKSVRYRLYLRAMDRGEIPTEDSLPEGQLFA